MSSRLVFRIEARAARRLPSRADFRWTAARRANTCGNRSALLALQYQL